MLANCLILDRLLALIFEYLIQVGQGKVALTDVKGFEIRQEQFIEDVISEKYVRKQVIII